jgi:hypothetical protein
VRVAYCLFLEALEICFIQFFFQAGFASAFKNPGGALTQAILKSACNWLQPSCLNLLQIENIKTYPNSLPYSMQQQNPLKISLLHRRFHILLQWLLTQS